MAFQYAKALYPLDPTGQTSLLPICDPSLAKILDYLKFVIVKYAGTAITTVITVPTTDRNSATLTSSIAQVVPIDPDTIARFEEFQFPLFCGWSKSTTYNNRTQNWIQDKRSVGLAYILPPLGGAQSVLWVPVLNSISHIVNAALKAGHDVGYNSDERVVADNFITSARLMTAAFGHYDFAGKQTPPYFPAWVADLELVEQQAPYTTGLDPLTGTDFIVTQQVFTDASTTITANAAVAATSIQVASTSGFAALDVIRIGEGTAREETISVTSVTNSTHLALDAAGLVFAHTAVQADTVKRDPVRIVQAKSEIG